MATVTFDAVVYDGKPWSSQGHQPPDGKTASLLFDLGYRQVLAYAPRGGSRTVLTGPVTLLRGEVQPNSTIVHHAGKAVAVLAGDQTDKPTAKKAAKKTTAKKTTAKKA